MVHNITQIDSFQTEVYTKVVLYEGKGGMVCEGSVATSKLLDPSPYSYIKGKSA